ncbi:MULTISPECIES: arginine N-succinyltransferase [unclassified Pseudoalteromonas]|uniref:arginine N-succinyltransferase n=1 Tax=unclassified Pseudoalteromonas TaxID=194690 RepID=UPI00257F2DED|nr:MULTISPECIES: arginine N-succinyltransferase [unclassified Pseudoalteromonas]|tara:strand:+ start:10428 stop:11462 length:1035 start_codon:yes stop_codon:yes gene_type:complete
MQVLRPITTEDFAALKQIAIESGHGFTSLPVDDQQLKDKIDRAEKSFAKNINQPLDESYLFVLEDSETGEVIGTTAIEAAVGLSVPLYHYHLGKTVHHSPKLNVYNTVDILSMCNDYTGCSEICTLFLRENSRKGLTGRFLSRSRFLFMAQHSERFADTVIAEMRGVSDEDGHSPFWQWLQEHFFSIEFPKADHLVGLGDKVFISELMPKYPIYVNLLSKKAQAVIGNVHEKTKPALKLLEKEGFEHRGYVDLFDAGPTVEAKLGNIRSIRESQVCPITIGELEHISQHSSDTLAVCNQGVSGFRATFTQHAHYNHAKHTLVISQEVADALNLSQGDAARFFRL